MENVVELKNLEFSYKEGSPLLNIPSFHLEKGEKVFLYGPSGSGKSTLLGLLTGVLSLEKGELKVLGNDFSSMSSRQRDKFRGAHIGYIFQSFNLLPSLNVLENVLLPCQLHSKRSSSAQKQEAESLLQSLGLGDYLEAKVFELSIGQCQRVAVARALIGSPDLIIADEPTSSLDEEVTQVFLERLIAGVEEKGSTLLFVSHDKRLKSLFDRSLDLGDLNEAKP